MTIRVLPLSAFLMIILSADNAMSSFRAILSAEDRLSGMCCGTGSSFSMVLKTLLSSGLSHFGLYVDGCLTILSSEKSEFRNFSFSFSFRVKSLVSTLI